MKSTPSLRKALVYLLQRCIRTGNMRYLPSIDELGCAAGVSRQTMWKALRKLRAERVLELHHGKGFLVTAPVDRTRGLLDEYETTPERPDTSEVGGPAFRVVADALRSDIITGQYRYHTSLPSFKELQNRYHTSYETLKKALEVCVHHGMVYRYKSRYFLTTSPRQVQKKRICLITNHVPLSDIHFPTLSDELKRTINDDCMRRGLRLETIEWEFTDDSLYFFHGAEKTDVIAENDLIAGYIFVVGFSGPLLEKMLRRISHLTKPTAILDINGEWKRPSYLNKPRFRIYTTAVCQKAGSQVGHFLGSLGHRKIAYISPFHRALWSQRRFQGLSQAISHYAPDAKAVPITLNNPAVVNTVYEKDARNECDVDAIIDFYRSWKNDIPEHYNAFLDRLFLRNLPHVILPTAFFNQRIHSLFSRALAYEEITAWVTANDQVGIEARDFLTCRQESYPRPISLISFDDTPPALQKGLSSYNFNLPSIGHLMLEWILFGRKLPSSGRRRPISIQGTVVERQSTARVNET
jgi:DNA-binding transcriptional regulator YhcF (GntR family)